jgi:hypothetical protein
MPTTMMTSVVDDDDAKANNNASTTATTATTAEENDEDTVLFGSMNADIANALADRIHAAIAQGVESLPLLQATGPLVISIEQSYMRIVDVIEAYGRRNIFTIAHYPPRHRQRILLQATATATTTLQQTNNDDNDDKENATPESPKAEGGDVSSKMKNPESFEYPSKEQIPSPEAISDLDKELSQLHERLQAARKRRNELLVKQQSLEGAKSVASKTMDSLQSLDDSRDVQGPVTAAIMGGQGVQELTREGKQLIAKLDDSKRDRSDDEEEDSHTFQTNVRKKRLSMEEEYREQRRTVDTTLDSLAAVRSLLQK